MGAPSRDTLDRQSQELLRSAAVGEAIDASHTRLCDQHPDIAPKALRIALLEALSHELGQQARREAAAARRAGTTWRELAEALGLSLSAVRHRYDTETVAARRRYDGRRRNR